MGCCCNKDMTLKIMKTNVAATLPHRGSASAAGWDLYTPMTETYNILPGQVVKINTGIAMAIPEGCFGAIYARSGMATKQGLRPANCVGVIDSDYRGDVIVALHNDSDEVQIIPPGTRIAQLVIQSYLDFTMEEVSSLDETERGDGGFGSSGTN